MTRKKFYDISEVQDGYKVSKGGGTLATFECKWVDQYGEALWTSQDRGSLFLPSKFGSSMNYRNGFVRVMMGVKKVILYSKSNGGDEVLMIRVEEKKGCGYWTMIGVESFTFDLTDDIVDSRVQDLFRIPYSGESEAEILAEFDYLPEYVFKVGDKVYMADLSDIKPELRELGTCEVQPLPELFEYIKVIFADGSESLECFDPEMSWGPFHKIIKYENLVLPTTFLGQDADKNVCGMFYNRYLTTDDDTKSFGMIVFKNPVTLALFGEVRGSENNAGNEFAIWKLFYTDSRDNEIFIYSLTSGNDLQMTIRLDTYI